MLRKLFGAVSAVFSLGSAMFFVMAISDLVTGTPDTAPGVLAGLAVFFGGLTVMTGLGARRLLFTEGAAARTQPLESAHGPAIDIALEQRVLALAAKHDGRVTVAEVAVACTVSLDDAERALDGLAQRGHADLHVTPSGERVYVVRGFLSESEKALAEDVVTHER